MDNYFSLVFNNSVLKKLIFNHVRLISARNGRKVYRWNEVIASPRVMAIHNYFDHLKKYLEDNKSKSRLEEIEAISVLENAIKIGSLEMLQYILDYIHNDKKTN
ncbi:hypothetical protein PPL_02769 [Heterostelium album PN500]|uniref:Uncharacterized protein n=1 Tax=Heterostelium pallidum (strain ATCC 26659 / Pp 5 / PN500) TaxID=670386 RepID=D3B304_HETP5|nr:hypothetical protein PPL_02769 [Heterostelium album PN500]EFA83702.1 hypothetical protein PPL_02769 [Heterostelium album PN500]|eukprot:XP_020435819.1 hypothetical protein PPL_02769 [Heterostelium album PN500]